MPTDITGTSVLDLRTNDFAFRRGPLFAQVVLADEINRATPKTQAALLEAMQEHQITVDGVSHPLPEPFFVLATQNPIELEGTFPLPEAQLDRFLLRVRLGYPDEEQEERILRPRSRAAAGADRRRSPACPAIRDLQDLVAGVALEHPVRRYIVSLARATRDHPELAVGASPRAVEQIGDAARAWALLDGREYVLPDDVKLARRARARPSAGADHRRADPRPDGRRDPARGAPIRSGARRSSGRTETDTPAAPPDRDRRGGARRAPRHRVGPDGGVCCGRPG